MRKIILSSLLFLSVVGVAASQTKAAHLTAAEAKNHVGERATVCGKVASSHYAQRSRGEPTFLNLDEPYPREIFTIVIWGNDRAKFGESEQKYRDKNVCVTGTIASYRGTPEIAASQPEQINLVK